jgi:hypothetical protein
MNMSSIDNNLEFTIIYPPFCIGFNENSRLMPIAGFPDRANSAPVEPCENRLRGSVHFSINGCGRRAHEIDGL